MGLAYAVSLYFDGLPASLLFVNVRFGAAMVGASSVARWVGLMALSLAWGLYAFALLATGFWREWRSLRLVALGLFGLTGLKLVLVDMAGVEDIYRIISFFVIGVLMVSVSYLYHRVERDMQV